MSWSLSDGYHALPPGKIASVVTYLEMRQRPQPRALALPEGYAIRRVERPDPDWYLDLFRRIGEPWLWFGRLVMSREELLAIIHHEQVDVFALSDGVRDQGLLELDRRGFPEIELAYFGITPELTGKGLGGALMERAIEEAWRYAPSRFWVHTCTLDSPFALGFYQKSGFVPFARAVEIATDPRLTGALPSAAAPAIPRL